MEEYARWCEIIGISDIPSLNTMIRELRAKEVINVSEALQSRKLASIADTVKAEGKKIVMIAGPSSSGKTSSSKRIAMECRVLGLKPKTIELDNYFVNREDTPRDENGEYDFENLNAMDLDLLGRQINDMLEGKAVQIPRFDFVLGRRVWDGPVVKMNGNDVLIMEGIHAMNPDMIPSIDPSKVYRVYVSALTTLMLDKDTRISTTDNRLIRRIIRDNRVRGVSPEETLLRWESVKKGQNKYIFPYQENADIMFNSALNYELAMLRVYAEPLLRRISPESPVYGEARRLLDFIGHVTPLTLDEISAIPPTSIMREFIGGQTL